LRSRGLPRQFAQSCRTSSFVDAKRMPGCRYGMISVREKRVTTVIR
jgi:hypothetical protein